MRRKLPTNGERISANPSLVRSLPELFSTTLGPVVNAVDAVSPPIVAAETHCTPITRQQCDRCLLWQSPYLPLLCLGQFLHQDDSLTVDDNLVGFVGYGRRQLVFPFPEIHTVTGVADTVTNVAFEP